MNDNDQVISYLELEGEQTIAITQKRKLLLIDSAKSELVSTLNLNAKEFRLNGQGETMHLIDRNQNVDVKMTPEQQDRLEQIIIDCLYAKAFAFRQTCPECGEK